MADDTEVGIVVRWAESGQNVPTRVRQALNELKGSSDNAAGSVGTRLTEAFERLERRQPASFIRQANRAIEEMAVTAAGATGPLGRLGVSFAGLAPGGLTTLGVIGGLGLIGQEIKHIIEFSGQLEDRLLSLNEAAARSIGRGGTQAAAIFQMSALNKTIDEGGSQPGIVDRLLARLSVIFDRGDYMKAVDTGRETEVGTATFQRNLLQKRIDDERDQAVAERQEALRRTSTQAAEAIGQMTFTLERARLGTHATTLELHDLAVQSQLLHVSTMNVTDAQGHRIAALVQERDKLYELTWQAGLLRRMEILGMSPYAAQLANERLRGFGPAQRLSSTSGMLRGGPIDFITQPGGPTSQEMFERSQRGQAIYTSEEKMSMYRAVAGESDRNRVPMGARLNVAQLIGSSAAALGALGGGGDLGQMLMAGGGAVGAFPGAEIPGAALTAIGGLFHLFSGGHARVSISRLEAEALEQMRSVMHVPQNVSVNAVTANPNDLRGTKYALDRMTRLDTVTRGPV